MVHLLRTHSAISKKMVIIPNRSSNDKFERGKELPLRELDGSESSFPGLDRRQPVVCVGAPELTHVIASPALDSVATDDGTG